MAMSLALNWNLPASTPLFDEDSPLTTTDSAALQKQRITASPQSHSGPSTPGAALHSVDNAPVPKSYAAAASNHRSSPSVHQAPSSVYGGVGLSGQPNYGLNRTAPNTGFASFQGNSQRMIPRAVVTEDGRRIRTTSGPQKPTHLTYNDTLHNYPGLPSIAALHSSRPGLPPGAMQPVGISHAASSPSISANSGYHPYRRTHKTSESPSTSPTSYSNVASVPSFGTSSSIPLPASTDTMQLPQMPPRARSSSSSSASGQASPSSARRHAAPSTTTYSSILSAGAGTRTGSTQQPLTTVSAPISSGGNPSPQQTMAYPANRPAPSRQDSASSIDAGSLRTADPAASTESFATAGSNASQSSLHAADRQMLSSPLSNGRTTPIARKPSPSPLSGRPSAVGDDDGPVNSDDEITIGGRTTPTPGDKQKKSLSGKLRKALSLSTLQQVEAAAAAPDRAYGGRTNVATKRADGSPFPYSSAETNGSSGSTRSTSPPRTPDNGAPILGSSAASISSRRSTRPPISGAEGTTKRSIFNRKFNSSTDNISISSTVSSASMMLRKVGNLGKLAKRSNIMGLTNMFNRDKENGRSGMHSDDFGTLPVSSDREAPAGPSVDTNSKSKAKKGTPALASVSHATVELERTVDSGSGDANMTPAASYVRQHQMHMRAEAERLAREKAEAERQAMNNKPRNRAGEDGMEGRQKMIEKEKERLKSKRGWRKRLVGSLGGSSDAQQMTGLEVVPLDETAMQDSSKHSGVPGGFQVPSRTGAAPAQHQLGNPAHHYQDNSIDSSFTDENLEPPQLPGALSAYDSSEEFETDSLRHWGEGIERSRESAAKITSVKGILKASTSYNELSASTQGGAFGSIEKPFAGRLRANSYDAPQTSSQAPSQVPLMSHISTGTSTDRVDGVSRPSEDHSSSDVDGSYSRQGANTPTQSISHGSSIGHHANSSLPALSLMMDPPDTNVHSQSTMGSTRKRLVFADTHIYHSTWPAHVYDRRGELATCNRLTPLLAQRIKEELNTYKMEEMAVAPSSRIHTHFFV